MSVTALPRAFVAILRVIFSDGGDRGELVSRRGRLVLLVKRKTRRFGIFMVIGMLITAAVVLGWHRWSCCS